MSAVHTRIGGALVVALALTAAACANDDPTGSAARSTAAPATTTVAPASTTAPGGPTGGTPGGKVVAPDAVGPYRVGRRTIQVTDPARSRPLTVDVWYPAAPDAQGAPSRYSFLPTIFFDSEVALDAPPVSTDAPFPLVVYSHGSGGLRYVASFFTEVLASHGFVVVSVDHTGDTATDIIGGTDSTEQQNAYDRVADVHFLIDEMLRQGSSTISDPQQPLELSIDPDHIGIVGHSFGGFTALAAASGFTNEIGSVPADDRIDAVVAMAPFTRILDDEALESVDVPTMLITGTEDTTTPIVPMTERPWDHVSGRPLYRADLVGGGHQSFTDVCAYQDLLPTLPDVPAVLIETVDRFAAAGCTDEYIDIDRAHEVTDTFVVSFLETQLAGISQYGNVLSTDGASVIPEVEFSVKEG